MSLRMSIIKCPTGATSFPEVKLTGNKFPLETGALRLLQAPSMLFKGHGSGGAMYQQIVSNVSQHTSL
jgi:hypothetical protein